MQFFVPFDPDSPWGPKMGFGAWFCVEPVKMRNFHLKKIWFVSNTSTPHSTGTRKWVPWANFDEKCPKSPKIDFFWKSLRNSQSDLWSWNFTKTALWGLKKLKNRIFVIFGFFDLPGPTLEKFVAENFGKKPTIFQNCAWRVKKKQKWQKLNFLASLSPKEKIQWTFQCQKALGGLIVQNEKFRFFKNPILV